MTVAECGHNFCRACLNQWWGEKDTEASCPQCRGASQKGNLRPNRPLAKIAEIAKKFRDQGVKGAEEKGRFCREHQEPLKLFCKDHESPICVVCDRSKEHENHKVVPLEEASQEYKVGGNQCRSSGEVEELGRVLLLGKVSVESLQ